MHDAEDGAVEGLTHFGSSTNPYDRWFREQLEKLHDLDQAGYAQLLFEFDPGD